MKKNKRGLNLHLNWKFLSIYELEIIMATEFFDECRKRNLLEKLYKRKQKLIIKDKVLKGLYLYCVLAKPGEPVFHFRFSETLEGLEKTLREIVSEYNRNHENKLYLSYDASLGLFVVKSREDHQRVFEIYRGDPSNRPHGTYSRREGAEILDRLHEKCFKNL